MRRILSLVIVCLFLTTDSAWSDEIDTLILKLKDKRENWNVRSNTAWKLAQSADPRAVPVFSDIIDDKHENINMIGIACVAMGKFRVSEKVPRLIELLGQNTLGGRPAFALAQIKDPRVIPALIESRGMFHGEALHYYVTRTDPGNQEAVDYLKKAVQSGELEASLATLEYLIGEEEAAKFIPEQKELIVSVDKGEYKREIPAWKMAMKITVRNISETPFLIRLYASPSLCMVERRFRDFHEGEIELRSASKPLTPSKNVGEGWYAGVGGWEPLRIDPKEVLDLDCRFFYSSGGFGLGPEGEYFQPDNPQCRARIVYHSMSGHGWKRAYSQKFSLITRERKAGKDDLPALTQALTDTDADVRLGAVHYLSDVGAPATSALAGALADPEKEVRQAAAGALGQIGPGARQAIPELERLAEKDPQESVRRKAREALEKIRK